MSTFNSYQLPITNLGQPFTLTLPVNKQYYGIAYKGNIPFLLVTNLSAVDPGPTQPRTLIWVQEGQTFPSGYDELFGAFFANTGYLLMIQGMR